jgi:hypothetical protein
MGLVVTGGAGGARMAGILVWNAEVLSRNSAMTKTIWMMAGVWVLGAASVWAQAPAGAPAGANGICRDGTYSTAAAKSGACRGHKGVQTWYAALVPEMPAPTAETKPAPEMGAPTGETKPVPAMQAPTPGGGAAAVAAPAGKKLGPAAAAAAKTAAPGGGPGLVWVNTASKVYHCFGDPYYGKTKAGQYMTEDAAKASGAHGARGNGCQAK